MFTASTPDISTFLSAIPDRLTLATALYEKMLAPISSSPDSVGALDPDRAHPVLYVESCLRSAKFLLAVHEAQGSMPKALQKLVSPTWPETVPESGADQAHRARLNSLAPSNTVPRSSIASWLDSAYSPYLATVSVTTRIRVLADVANCFARIGYRRKEAFVLREVAALCTDRAASHERSEALQGAYEHRGLDLQRSASRLNSANNQIRPTPRRRVASSVATQLQVLGLIERACTAYGVAIAATGAGSRAQDTDTSRFERDTASLTEHRFGWPSLQLGVLQDAMRMTEALNGTRLVAPALTTRASPLTIRRPCEYRLPECDALHDPRSAVSCDRHPSRRPSRAESEYPADPGRRNKERYALQPRVLGPVAACHESRSPEVSDSHEDILGEAMNSLFWRRFRLAKSRQPHRWHVPSPAGSEGPGTSTPTTNPFLYDPRVQPSKSRESSVLLVQNEVVDVYVTLQNPFLFELQITALSLRSVTVLGQT